MSQDVQSSLGVLRSRFDEAARQHPDLRCVVVQGGDGVRHPIMRRLDGHAAPDDGYGRIVEWIRRGLGNRPVTHQQDFYTTHPSERWLVTFCGDSSGAHKFNEFALAASGCFREHAIWHSAWGVAPDRTRVSETLWIEVLFRAAWCSTGGLLQVQKHNGGELPEGASFSILLTDPFTASVLFIDRLLKDMGGDTEQPPKPGANKRRRRKGKGKGGRKPISKNQNEVERRRKFAASWADAKAVKRPFDDFCTDEDCTVSEGRAMLEWVRNNPK